MNLVEAINIMLLEKDVKLEELEAFPDNQHLKNYIKALKIVCDIAILFAVTDVALRKFEDKDNAK